jgi:hypothetical protein
MAALCWTSGSMTSPSMTGSESPYVIRDGWPSSYSEDNEPHALPAAIADVFRRSTSRTCFWEIQLTPTIEANCHFFTEDEIEFDLDPREILSASDLDAVCAFVQAVGRALRRPVHVCQEGDPPWPQDDVRYDPMPTKSSRCRSAIPRRHEPSSWNSPDKAATRSRECLQKGGRQRAG